MRRIITLFLCVITIAALFSGCESKPEYSFDKVICEYSWGGGFGTVIDTRSTSFTVYADNRIVVYSGHYEYGYSKEVSITEAQKQEIIDAINDNRVWGIGDISDDNVLDGGYQHINLFDANGQEVYECGGYAPSASSFKGMRFFNAVSVINKYVPREVLVEVDHESEKLLKEIYEIE